MLVTRVGSLVCAFPILHVIETMRPLPIEPVAGVPDFVAGLAIVRGSPVPVVNAAVLLGGVATPGTRFVIVRTGDRRVALVVDAVLDVRTLEPSVLAALPPLVGGTNRDIVRAIGALDAELVVVLDAARILSADAWRVLEQTETAS
ncbi:MAG: chemotaxis protein CheW [Myxococcales bacterium]|nr:chemotaxis protein CheW [Myxococcales bacterium]